MKLLTEHNFEFLNLKGGCTGSSESTLVKIPHCRKSHVTAHIEKHTAEATDAKVRIIHHGKNNLFENEQAEASVTAVADKNTSLKQAELQAKLIVPKFLPVGNRDLSVEGSVFNVHSEKKLLEYIIMLPSSVNSI